MRNLYGLTVMFRQGDAPGMRVVTARRLFRSKQSALIAAPEMIYDLEQAGPMRDVKVEVPEFEWEGDARETSVAQYSLPQEQQSREVGPAIVEGMGEGHARHNLERVVGFTVKGFDWRPDMFAFHWLEGGFVMINIAPDGRNLQVSFPGVDEGQPLDVKPERVM